jgi:lipid-binding SYLF domain-containing protein
VAIVPGVSKGAFIVGGSGGKGVATCRTATGWSAPAPIAAGGASIGLQVGGQSSDLVLFLMNDRGKNALLAGKFKASGDMSAAAGPVGARMTGSMDSDKPVFSYTRTQGLFAGMAVAGTKLDQDKRATKALYGRMVPFDDILNGNTAAPVGAEHLLRSMEKYAGGEGRASR